MEDIKNVISNIKGNIEPVKISFSYKIAIFIVFIFMILLPIIYLSLVISVAYLVYYHTFFNFEMLMTRGGGFARLIIYFSPIIIGGILLYFMIRPLFIKRKFEDDSIEIKAKNEPLLFEFITKICTLINAPVPKKVVINSEVNASASFSPGFSSFFKNDLILTIGAPLIYGLNIQQLAGVLAHEFGHFAQGAGMRISLLIRQINIWFAFIVSSRNTMDQILIRGANKTDGRIGIILIIARFFVWFTSNILYILMQTGNIISGFLLRQMEFDADKYEINFSGTKTFIETSENISSLGFTSQFAFADLRNTWHENKLINNFPKYLIAYQTKNIEKFKKIHEAIKDNTKQSLFDTHPTEKARIACAENLNLEGIFKSNITSEKLFSNFEDLSQQCSLNFFRQQIDPNIKEEQLLGIEEVLSMQKSIDRMNDDLNNYSYGIMSVIHPIDFFKYMDKIYSRSELIDELNSIRSFQDNNHKTALNELNTFAEIENDKILALQAENFLESGFKIDKKYFKLDESSVENSKKKYKDYLLKQSNLQNLYNYIDIIQKKYGITLSYYEQKKNLTAVNFNRFMVLKPIYKLLIESFSDIHQLRSNFFIIGPLLENIYANQDNQSLSFHIKNYIENSYTIMERLSKNYKKYFYPYDNSNNKISLDNYFFKNIPEKNEYILIFNYIETVLDKFFSFYTRILSELATYAIETEKSLGLQPLLYKQDDFDITETITQEGKHQIPFKEKFGPYFTATILIFIFYLIISNPFIKSRRNKRYIPNQELRLNYNTKYTPPKPELYKIHPSAHEKNIILFVDNIINDEIYLRIITTKTYADAENVVSQLDSGHDFAEIATAMSLHPSSKSGGYLGKFKLSDLDDLYKNAVKDLNIGEYSKIIKIVKVE